MDAVWPTPWLAMILLGAGHGLNPGMGWLFAVALGLQEGSGRAVLRALPPLALGHAAAIAAAIAVATLLGYFVEPAALDRVVAALLIGLGLRRLARTHHPNAGGMDVGARDLAVWSFLMATAHGAGLMVLPFLPPGLAASVHTSSTQHIVHAEASLPGRLEGLSAAALHAFAYLCISALLAAAVYRFAGVRMLRTMWFNVDRMWAAALIVTGIAAAIR